MNFLATIGKKFLFWTYPRTSWQWDVLCVLILVFIFLTPKKWFESKQFEQGQVSQNLGRQMVLLTSDVTGTQLDRAEIERRVKSITGHEETEVLNTRERRDSNGKLI